MNAEIFMTVDVTSRHVNAAPAAPTVLDVP